MKTNKVTKLLFLMVLFIGTVCANGDRIVMTGPTQGSRGGPVILMGIDAEDGGVGGHGPIAVYVSVVNSILSEVTNGGSGILVVGGGKSPDDQVTQFWNRIETDTGRSITYVNGPSAIATQSFSGFAMIAIVSSSSQTPSGGLTQAENDALATRGADIAEFVNNGGGLLGFSQAGLPTNAYAYIAGLGSFTFNLNLNYNNITPTPEGEAVGITNGLDVCCWHDEYLTFPSFLRILARNAGTGNAAAVGGSQVIIPPCSITCPSNITRSNDPNQCGAIVNYPAPTTTGDCGTVTCSPASGSFFPIGGTTVTCTATEGPSCSFTVTVNDTQAPTITCPTNIARSADPGQCSALVIYPAPTVSDNCPGVGTPTCTPASGSAFPVGTTPVTCNVTDARGNQSSCSFTVTISDTQRPSITCPTQSIEASTAPGQCTAVVDYAIATATDNCFGTSAPICLPPSGTTFPLGITTVTCATTDAAGNRSTCEITVRVRDTTRPTVVCPTQPITLDAGSGCRVALPDLRPRVTATDICTPAASLVITQSIAAGTQVKVGSHPVTITVTDAAGNSTLCQVMVNVTGASPSEPEIRPNPVNLESVKLLSTVKKRKKKKVKPTAVSGSFTIENPSCAPLSLTFKGIRRITDQSRFKDPNDTKLFSVFKRNPDGSRGEELIGKQVATGKPITIGPRETQSFSVEFNPAAPAVAPCTNNSCLTAADVVPNDFVSELFFDGTNRTVRFNAGVDKGVVLIDPATGQTDNPVVMLCKSGNQFIVRYHIYDSDKSDVKSVKYEFLDSSGNLIKAIDNVDLAGPISQTTLVNGQSFNVEQAFSGAEDNPEVSKVRVTVSGASSSSSATSGPIGSNCGASIQSLWEQREMTLYLPVMRLDAVKP